jgi:hypothetical protein
MKPHPRIRKTIKWGGVAFCGLVACAFGASLKWDLCWYAAYLPEAAASARTCAIGRGALMIAYAWSLPDGAKTVSVCSAERGDGPLLWLPTWRFDDWPPSAAVPLWIVFLLAAAPTGVMFYRDHSAARRRRRGLNLCPKCNYDRAGIARDAKCPECGSGGGAAP